MWLRVARIVSFLGAIVWALIFGGAADAQQLPTPIMSPGGVSTAPATAAAPSSMGEALRELTTQSAVVFLGRVRRIDYSATPTASQQSGFVTITLDVVAPLRGSLGSTYTLREWAGLWTFGRQRYTIGQRALFFLYAAGAGGFSSPVGGQMGVLPLVPLTAQQPPLLDVRLLATQVLRPVGATIPYAGTSGLTLADATRIITHPTEPLEPTLVALPGGLEPPLPLAPDGPSRARPILLNANPAR